MLAPVGDECARQGSARKIARTGGAASGVEKAKLTASRVIEESNGLAVSQRAPMSGDLRLQCVG